MNKKTNKNIIKLKSDTEGNMKKISNFTSNWVKIAFHGFFKSLHGLRVLI